MSNAKANRSNAADAQAALRLGSQERPGQHDADVPAVVTRSRFSNEEPSTPAPVYVPQSLRVLGAWAWRMIVVAVVLGGLVWAMRPLSTLIVAVLVALIIAVLLDPISGFFRRKLRFPSILASLVTILLTILVLSAALVLAGRQIFAQFPMLRDQALAGFDQLTLMLENTPFALGGEQLQELLDQAQAWVQENSSNLLSGAMSVGATLIDVAVGVLVGFFTLIFLLKDGRTIWQWFVRLMPAQSREAVNEAGIRSWVTLGDYARTQIVVAFIDGVGIALGAWFLGVPFVIPIGVMVFIASFVPILGAWISGAVAVLVALVTQGPIVALVMIGVVLLVQQLESSVFSPWLMSGAVSLHPLVVFLSVMAGSTLAGIAGALFAVPLAAMINTAVLYLRGHDKMPELNTRWDRPGGPPGVLLPSIDESYRKPTKDNPRMNHEQLDKMIMDRAGGPGAVPVPTPADAHVEWNRRHGVAVDPHEGPLPEGEPGRGEPQDEMTATIADRSGEGSTSVQR